MPASLSSSEFSRNVVGNHWVLGRYEDFYSGEPQQVICAWVGRDVRYFDCDMAFENWMEVSKEHADELLANER